LNIEELEARVKNLVKSLVSLKECVMVIEKSIVDTNHMNFNDKNTMTSTTYSYRSNGNNHVIDSLREVLI
jgi:hypothetical protein